MSCSSRRVSVLGHKPTKLIHGLVPFLMVGFLALGGPQLRVVFSATGSLSGDALRGKDYYERTCSGCHSIDQDRIGPRHRGVVGRRIASVEGFEYSPALKMLRGVWQESLLDSWLKDPQLVAPGTAMGFQVTDARDRADVIAYLKEVSKGPKAKPKRHTVSIEEFRFFPETLIVRAGDTIVWKNEDQAPHTATAEGVFDSGHLTRGATWKYLADKKGTFEYICHLHPRMKAKLIVL